MIPRVMAAVFALALMTIVGCGGSADNFEHLPIDGTITLDGTPLKSGRVSFIAQDKGGSASADVNEGAFQLRGADGLSPGPYRVEIYSIQPTGKKVPSAEDPTTMIDETKNLVPKQYNAQSELKADIPAGGPKEPLSYALKSAPAKRAPR